MSYRNLLAGSGTACEMPARTRAWILCAERSNGATNQQNSSERGGRTRRRTLDCHARTPESEWHAGDEYLAFQFEVKGKAAGRHLQFELVHIYLRHGFGWCLEGGESFFKTQFGVLFEICTHDPAGIPHASYDCCLRSEEHT